MSGAISSAHMVPMTTTLTRPRRPEALPLTVETVQVWGALLSSYSQGIGGISVWSTEDGALRHAERAVEARPGVEFELMTCIGNGPWRSVADGFSIGDVMAIRWAA